MYGLDYNGSWWSATGTNSDNAYSLVLNTGGIYTQDNFGKVNGRNLSCVSIKARRYPLSYVFSGYYYWGNGNLTNPDSVGYWWSTAANSDSNAYHVLMHSSALNPQSNANKALGFTLRCVSYSMLYPSVSAFVCVFRIL